MPEAAKVDAGSLRKSKMLGHVSHRHELSEANLGRPFQRALELTRLGVSVIPLDGKVPVVTWKEFADRVPHPAELKNWFTTESIRNVGIVCGRVSNLVVIDTDTREAAVEWERNYPVTPLVVETGGRGEGRHFYYRYPRGVDSVGNRVGVEGKKIDVRADCGVVVAPNSIHPVTGREYRMSQRQVTRDLLDSLPFFDPAWIPEPETPLLSPDRESAVRPQEPVGDQRNHDRARSYIARIEAVAGEGGDRATFRAACKLREFGLSREAALEELIYWNHSNAMPPWTTAELEHKINRAFRND